MSTAGNDVVATGSFPVTTPTPPPSTFAINGWRITTQKLPILKAGPIEDMTKSLGIPPPEMIFGDNYVRVEYVGGAGDQGEVGGTGGGNWKIEFNTFDALDRVDKTGQRMLKVAHSNEWQQSRLRQKNKKQKKPSNNNNNNNNSGDAETAATTTAVSEDNSNDEVQEIVNPFDWTYTTDYKGTTTSSSSSPPSSSFSPSTTPIPIELLKRPDPILFFDDVMLYEDELADNGISMYSVKIRVMHERLLLLARFFLRLDNVLLRLRDTRVYVDFAAKKVIREYVEKEESYDKLKEKSHSSGLDPAAAMRDPNEVADSMTVTGRRLEAVDLR